MFCSIFEHLQLSVSPCYYNNGLKVCCNVSCGDEDYGTAVKLLDQGSRDHDECVNFVLEAISNDNNKNEGLL